MKGYAIKISIEKFTKIMIDFLKTVDHTASDFKDREYFIMNSCIGLYKTAPKINILFLNPTIEKSGEHICCMEDLAQYAWDKSKNKQNFAYAESKLQSRVLDALDICTSKLQFKQNKASAKSGMWIVHRTRAITTIVLCPITEEKRPTLILVDTSKLNIYDNFDNFTEDVSVCNDGVTFTYKDKFELFYNALEKKDLSAEANYLNFEGITVVCKSCGTAQWYSNEEKCFAEKQGRKQWTKCDACLAKEKVGK